MRIALVLAFVLSLAACGKKKAPQAPAADQTEMQADPNAADEEKDISAPMDSDDAATSSDPEEGGE